MDQERETIRLIQKSLGVEGDKGIFETDAQQFMLDGQNFLFTTDEYSSEDFFRENNPYTLAWNLTTATLSDILAAGGVPMFYGHSMSIPSSWNNEYLIAFCKGINDCLSLADTKFLGGDTGFSDTWKYTGIAIGRQNAHINRSGAGIGDLIYMTGKVGAGNLEASLKMYSGHTAVHELSKEMNIKFPWRGKEASVIRKYATACIDSSDGMLKSLMNIGSCSALGFEVGSLPYMEEAVMACEMLELDKTLLFVGESGEYELVFTISPDEEMKFLNECEQLGVQLVRIGRMLEKKEYLLMGDKRIIDFTGFDIHARNYPDTLDYISAISIYIRQSLTGLS
ncbi:MAG: AIR synthase related protein [Bacteroidota bacterium]